MRAYILDKLRLVNITFSISDVEYQNKMPLMMNFWKNTAFVGP